MAVRSLWIIAALYAFIAAITPSLSDPPSFSPGGAAAARAAIRISSMAFIATHRCRNALRAQGRLLWLSLERPLSETQRDEGRSDESLERGSNARPVLPYSKRPT